MSVQDPGVPGVLPPAGSTPPLFAKKDIVYLSILAPLLLAALVEWFLFMVAFDFCLVRIYQKASKDWTIKLLSTIIFILFTGMRSVFLPIIFFTLPLPQTITQHFPRAIVDALSWFAFWSFAGLLIFPWLLCVYRLITHNVGRGRKIKFVFNEETAPKVVIVMPVYNEPPAILQTAIDSVVSCDYPPACLHVFLSFDGDKESETYLSMVQHLGIEMMMKYPKCIDAEYKGTRVTLSRFEHEGKRKTQKKTFVLIDRIYKEYLERNDNLFILFIDSDCVLDKLCIQNFMYEMELKPGSDRNMLAMTGVITCTARKHGFLSILQDIEYIHGQLFERSVESACGAVTCLPGALTMLRFSAFKRMATFYFADGPRQTEDLFDHAKISMGEDRWLTHLFMVGARHQYQIQMCTGAFCKTEAVETFKALLSQRRRWFLGSITNEACMLTDWRLWYKYPIMCLYRFMQCTIRTTALLFFILMLALISTEASITNLPIGFLAVSLGLNWLLMFYFGFALKRYKVWLYPIMFCVNPFFNFVYMTYGIWTSGTRQWGGPRSDAAKADDKVSPQEAIEIAALAGDDLNIVPETFQPAIARKESRREPTTAAPVLPAATVEGRFAAPEVGPGGFYMHPGNVESQELVEFNTATRPPFLDSPTRLSMSSYMNVDTNSIYRARLANQEIDITENDARKMEVLRKIKEQHRRQISEMEADK